MTTNQIEYYKARTQAATADEARRHNLETERVADYSARSTAQFQREQGEASLRQAGAAELNAQTRRSELAESIRSNMAREALESDRNVETHRHNAAMEYVEGSKISEQSRHNRAVESETNRANEASEKQLAKQLFETVRHNTRSETFTEQELLNAIRELDLKEADISSLMARRSWQNLTDLLKSAKTISEIIGGIVNFFE